MYGWPVLMVLVTVSTATAAAQSEKDFQPTGTAIAGRTEDTAVTIIPAGAPIGAALTKSVDSKKVKVGDPVVAETTEATKDNGTVVIPRGAKLEGHITQSSSRSNGDSFSTVGIVFDKAWLKDGKEVPLNVVVQAIAAPPEHFAQPSMPDPGMSPSESNPQPGTPAAAPGMGTSRVPTGQPGEVTPSPNETNTTTNTDVGNANAGKRADGGIDSTGRLTAKSKGVFGLHGIGLAEASTSTQPYAAVITSTDKKVHLESGTQLLLVAHAPMSVPKS